MSSVPQRSALRLVLFEIFIRDLDNGIKYFISSKLADDTKLCVAADTIKGRDARYWVEAIPNMYID